MEMFGTDAHAKYARPPRAGPPAPCNVQAIMFGCVVAGRPLLTDLTQIDDTHAYFSLVHASSINHITIFLTGAVPFPSGVGASVHLFWPGKGFQLLGMLSNDKPSAIFRLRGTFTAGTGTGSAQGVFGGVGPDTAGEDVTAVLGLAIEPLEGLQSSSSTALVKQQQQQQQQPSTSDAVILAEKIVKHLLNYVSGFTAGGPDVLVPMGMIMKWYENFVGKIRASASVRFLDNVE